MFCEFMIQIVLKNKCCSYIKLNSCRDLYHTSRPNWIDSNKITVCKKSTSDLMNLWWNRPLDTSRHRNYRGLQRGLLWASVVVKRLSKLQSSLLRWYHIPKNATELHIILLRALAIFDINSLRLRRNGCNFADGRFKCIFNKNVLISIKSHWNLFLRVQLTIF